MPSKILTLVISLTILSLCVGLSAASTTTIAVPDDGWRLWPDTKAEWKVDSLYLPDEVVDLTKIPNNPPTGGWEMLGAQNGIAVTLPSTVEQHFWGTFGF